MIQIRSILILSLIFSLPAAVFAAAQQGEANPFDGHRADSIFSVIAFAGLLFVLWRFAWKPLLGALNARQEYIEKQISDAEATKKEAQGVLNDYHKKLAGFEDEGAKILESRRKQAEEEGQKIIAKVKEEVDEIKARAQIDIDRARRVAEAELVGRSGEIVMHLGKEILGKSLNNDDNKALFDNAIRKLQEEGQVD